MSFKVGQGVTYLDGTLGRVESVGAESFSVIWDDGEFSTHPYDTNEVSTLKLVSVNLDPVNNPTHYQHPSGIEVIDITRHESFLRGNVIKYVLRAPYKGNEVEDIKKALKYLTWELERLEKQSDV